MHRSAIDLHLCTAVRLKQDLAPQCNSLVSTGGEDVFTSSSAGHTCAHHARQHHACMHHACVHHALQHDSRTVLPTVLHGSSIVYQAAAAEC
ncbi:hypothetical protein DUNSADRAFT_4211 [Dunaliella salina]|uniref:Uncharacterized protein n=1 Tax=Dunaliella salina TaxID=3046 RepID=A0ABQ7FUX4_DUNSA|nr:hypothetical protein DUNSADRAFT_4211 [Dunaliella salina]|eukprot:KAF5826195.1 hypothetical protein DUNSADRAFT_4211 [Dunaliella salina]